MDVDVVTDPDGKSELVLNGLIAVTDLSEHDLRDLVFVLEQRRAMGRTCPGKDGEHTCSMAPGHGPDPGHVCRACDLIWPGVG